MDLSKLTYSKADSSRTPADTPLHKATMESKNESGMPETIQVPLAYKKPEGVFSTSFVFVLSGGEKRERDFLKELIQPRKLRSLKVAFMSEKGQGLQPYQMQDKWVQIQSKGEIKIKSQLFHLEAMDKVFLLSDVDEFYDQLKKIFKDDFPKTKGQWIVSNPCFEIWLYYCYLNNPEEDLMCLKAEPAATRSKKMKAICNTLISGGMNPRLAFERMVTGIDNSTTHYAVDDNGIPVSFATQMHEMAQYLVDVMNKNDNEYSEYVKREEERRRLMRR
jgi:hypothetical protein